MFRIVRAAFNQRRKTLANGILNGLTVEGKRIPVTREEVNAVLADSGLPVSVRGETLSLVQFAAIAGKLKALKTA